MTSHKTVTITVDGENHVIEDLVSVDITTDGALVVTQYMKGVVRALGPGHWDEVRVDDAQSGEVGK